MSILPDTQLYIDGKLRPATGGRTFDNVSPWTGEIIGHSADAAPADVEEAIAASADTERAIRIANRIRTGTISVNGGMCIAGDLPFGGYENSGIGRAWGIEGIEEYFEKKALAWRTQ
jgi:acyl-CoA reductase-like NAD-dependent aldehyde dehydrogenase